MSGVRGGDEPLSYPGPGRQVCGSRDDDEMGSRRLGDDESEDLVVTVEGRVKSAV